VLQHRTFASINSDWTAPQNPTVDPRKSTVGVAARSGRPLPMDVTRNVPQLYTYRMSYAWLPPPPIKPRIFVSYHHGGDAWYYDAFSRIICETYDVAHDSSVDRVIDSVDSEYVIRHIREKYITGTSCTVVLCGGATPGRKFVDWEIKSTLDKEHALVGINLPSNRPLPDGTWPVPERFLDNYRSGYAVWGMWNDVLGDPRRLVELVQDARAREKSRINNSRPLKVRNS
jgi:hypothetical protein